MNTLFICTTEMETPDCIKSLPQEKRKIIIKRCQLLVDTPMSTNDAWPAPGGQGKILSLEHFVLHSNLSYQTEYYDERTSNIVGFCNKKINRTYDLSTVPSKLKFWFSYVNPNYSIGSSNLKFIIELSY